MNKKFLAGLLFLALATISVTPAVAVTTYKTCADLRKTFTSGVSLSSDSKNKGLGPIAKPRVSQAVYSKNRKLDVDKDGIACEVIVKSATPSLTPNPPSPTPPPPIDPEAGWLNSAPSISPEVCKLADARTIKRQPSNVGFPLRPDLIPSEGTVNLVVIPVDFSDRPADAIPSEYLKAQTEKMATWYESYSAGKLKLTFQIGTSWVRAPKPDSSYVVPKNQANTPGAGQDIQMALAQDVVTAAGVQFDFGKAHGVFLYMPTIQSVDYDMGLRGSFLQTPAGNKPLFLWGGGAYHFDNRNLSSVSKREKMWAFYIHEMLHSQDQALHAPGNGFSAGLGQNQYGSSLVLSTWELFRFGWIDDSVICIDKKDIGQGTNAIIRPLENTAKGMKSVIVKLNQFEVLVIESRRPIGYSAEYPGLQGALVYRIDTRLDNDRSGEGTGRDTGNSEEFPKWGYYLAPEGKSSFASQSRNLSDFVFKPGDSRTFSGVKVTVTSTSNNGDYVSFTNVG
jgi:hypothetical protein